MIISAIEYFSFNNNNFLEADVVCEYLTEEFILEADHFLVTQNIDASNIYFKLLAQLYYLESKTERNLKVLSHLNYLIGYYLGLFLHPFCGEELALYYVNKAISIETDSSQIEKYYEVIAMIKEEI